MKQLRIIIIIFIVTAVTAFLWLTAGTDLESLVFERLKAGDQHLVLMVTLISAFILLSTLSGLPVLYLSIALGFLLPFLPAMFISMAVNLLAVTATFYLVRFAFSSSFQDKFGSKKLIKRINRRIQKYGLWTVVFSRSIYIIPTNIINFSFPLSRIPVRSYFWGTLLGLIPESMINVGSGYLIKHEIILLSSPESRVWEALAIGAFILIFALAFILLKIRQNRRKKFRRLKAVPYRS